MITLTLNGSENKFLLGSAEIAEGTDLTVYSPDSPIGKAILGQKIGDEVSFVAPNGRTIEVKILAVEHFNG